MAAYFVRRLAYAVLTFFGISVATFVLIHSVPGDPLVFFVPKSGLQGAAAETIAAIKAEYHLDQPLPVQYAWWLRGIVTGDLGRSIKDRRPVMQHILEKVPNTIELNAIAFLLAGAIGIPVGLWSAVKTGRAREQIVATLSFLLYSLPNFWVALVLMEFLSVRWDILPLFGRYSDDAHTLGDHLRHLVLPVITLAYGQVAVFMRFSKSALSEVIRQDFITTARAKGAGEATVIWSHGLRNALIPLITLFGTSVTYLLSGTVIVEQIFEWDGIGALYISSILNRDYPIVMGLTVVTAVIALLAMLITDVLYAMADPRVRVGERAR